MPPDDDGYEEVVQTRRACEDGEVVVSDDQEKPNGIADDQEDDDEYEEVVQTSRACEEGEAVVSEGQENPNGIKDDQEDEAFVDDSDIPWMEREPSEVWEEVDISVEESYNVIDDSCDLLTTDQNRRRVTTAALLSEHAYKMTDPCFTPDLAQKRLGVFQLYWGELFKVDLPTRVIECRGREGKAKPEVPPVVVATDEDTVYLAFRGTRVLDDWFSGAHISGKQFGEGNDGCSAHRGFLERSQKYGPGIIHPVVEDGVRAGKAVVFAGHSLGGAVACIQLAQALLARRDWAGKVLAVTFGAPFWANARLCSFLSQENITTSMHQFFHPADVVPTCFSLIGYEPIGYYYYAASGVDREWFRAHFLSQIRITDKTRRNPPWVRCLLGKRGGGAGESPPVVAEVDGTAGRSGGMLSVLGTSSDGKAAETEEDGTVAEAGRSGGMPSVLGTSSDGKAAETEEDGTLPEAAACLGGGMPCLLGAGIAGKAAGAKPPGGSSACSSGGGGRGRPAALDGQRQRAAANAGPSAAGAMPADDSAAPAKRAGARLETSAGHTTGNRAPSAAGGVPAGDSAPPTKRAEEARPLTNAGHTRPELPPAGAPAEEGGAGVEVDGGFVEFAVEDAYGGCEAAAAGAAAVSLDFVAPYCVALREKPGEVLRRDLIGREKELRSSFGRGEKTGCVAIPKGDITAESAGGGKRSVGRYLEQAASGLKLNLLHRHPPSAGAAEGDAAQRQKAAEDAARTEYLDTFRTGKALGVYRTAAPSCDFFKPAREVRNLWPPPPQEQRRAPGPPAAAPVSLETLGPKSVTVTFAPSEKGKPGVQYRVDGSERRPPVGVVEYARFFDSHRLRFPELGPDKVAYLPTTDQAAAGLRRLVLLLDACGVRHDIPIAPRMAPLPSWADTALASASSTLSSATAEICRAVSSVSLARRVVGDVKEPHRIQKFVLAFLVAWGKSFPSAESPGPAPGYELTARDIADAQHNSSAASTLLSATAEIWRAVSSVSLARRVVRVVKEPHRIQKFVLAFLFA
ncbi:Lipase [Diplonema papillatum]|nr:Lipase [Diplonema papillatum]